MSWLDSSYFTDPVKRESLVTDDYLSPDQITTATVQNPRWQQKLGSNWQGHKISQFADHPESVQFAEDVRGWQLSNTGWEPDGVLGPQTNEAIRGDVFMAPAGKDYFLIDNVYLTSEGLRVVTPEEPGALITDHVYATGNTSPDLFVVHWDGCMNSHSCHDVLEARKLSVTFMLDEDGTVFQEINPARQIAWHAGTVNRRSWGVEVANPVLPERNSRCDHPRPLTTMKVRGDTHSILGFQPIQLEALAGLIDWSCDYTKIPRQVPCYKGQIGVLPPAESWQRVANSYIKGPGDHWNVNNFKGICGHYHQSDTKCDPGMDVFGFLIDRLGLKVVEVG